MPGPLPNPQRRRRNAPTVNSSQLPAAGRKGRPPKCPYDLGKPGAEWWKWAWALPQATKWDKGALYIVARRAQLEDELAALRAVDGRLDLTEVLGRDLEDLEDAVAWLVRSLKSHASGSTSVMREMRELDNRLGLNPKALAELRWSIEDSDGEAAKPSSGGAKVTRLRAV